MVNKLILYLTRVFIGGTMILENPLYSNFCAREKNYEKIEIAPAIKEKEAHTKRLEILAEMSQAILTAQIRIKKSSLFKA